ncbi:MAG: hypothetical protein ACOYMR_04640 [Ilumatobacteraceae bacterium]
MPPGPIAPWRFAVSVLAVALLLGRSILDAANPDRFERIVAVGAAFGLVVWFALGVIDRALSTARDRVPPQTDADTRPARGTGTS